MEISTTAFYMFYPFDVAAGNRRIITEISTFPILDQMNYQDELSHIIHSGKI